MRLQYSTVSEQGPCLAYLSARDEGAKRDEQPAGSGSGGEFDLVENYLKILWRARAMTHGRTGGQVCALLGSLSPAWCSGVGFRHPPVLYSISQPAILCLEGPAIGTTSPGRRPPSTRTHPHPRRRDASLVDADPRVVRVRHGLVVLGFVDSAGLPDSLLRRRQVFTPPQAIPSQRRGQAVRTPTPNRHGHTLNAVASEAAQPSRREMNVQVCSPIPGRESDGVRSSSPVPCPDRLPRREGDKKNFLNKNRWPTVHDGGRRPGWSSGTSGARHCFERHRGTHSLLYSLRDGNSSCTETTPPLAPAAWRGVQIIPSMRTTTVVAACRHRISSRPAFAPPPDGVSPSLTMTALLDVHSPQGPRASLLAIQFACPTVQYSTYHPCLHHETLGRRSVCESLRHCSTTYCTSSSLTLLAHCHRPCTNSGGSSSTTPAGPVLDVLLLKQIPLTTRRHHPRLQLILPTSPETLARLSSWRKFDVVDGVQPTRS
nr:hypothetical protein CFP56_21068 [Quercus suber]